MPPLSPKQTYRVEGVSQHCEEFLRLRVEAALRLSPSVEPALEDLVWLKIMGLQEVLSNTREFDGKSFLVADILTLEDDEKRQLLLSEQHGIGLHDQVAPSNDLIDPRYASLNPSLKNLADLIGDWLWWDLPDAIDWFVFDQALQRFNALGASPLTAPVVEAYRVALQKPEGAEVSREEMLGLEADKCARVVERFAERHGAESPARMLIAHEAEDREDASEDDLIMEIATSLTGIGRLEDNPTLDPRARAYYGDLLNLPPEAVTAESAIGFERARIHELRGRLLEGLQQTEPPKSRPYDHKSRLLKQLRGRLPQAPGQKP